MDKLATFIGGYVACLATLAILWYVESGAWRDGLWAAWHRERQRKAPAPSQADRALEGQRCTCTGLDVPHVHRGDVLWPPELPERFMAPTPSDEPELGFLNHTRMRRARRRR